MESITSKRHFLNFYGMLLFSLFFGTLGVLLLFIHNPDKKTIAIIGGVLFIILSIYLGRSYIKSTPKITITNKDISFNNKSFKIEDIQRIKLKGKNNFSFSYEKESVTIFFKSGEIKYIFDDMYSNISKMKLFLDKKINNSNIASIHKVTITLIDEHFNFYKGSFFWSLRGGTLIFFLCTALTSAFISFKTHNVGVILITGMFIFFCIIFHRVFYYFGLNSDYFIIKNQMKFWKNDVYRIEDIKEIVFEKQGSAPHCLRLTLKDYTTKKYTASTLSERKWNQLKNNLRKLRIKVRNEL